MSFLVGLTLKGNMYVYVIPQQHVYGKCTPPEN